MNDNAVAPNETAIPPALFSSIRHTLEAVSTTLAESRGRMQILIGKIHKESNFGIPLAPERKHCLDRALDFRLGVSDLIEAFWENSARLGRQCDRLREHLATPPNRSLALAISLYEESQRLTYHALLVFAQISLIHRAISACKDVLATIFDQTSEPQTFSEDSPEMAIRQLFEQSLPPTEAVARQEKFGAILLQHDYWMSAEVHLNAALVRQDFLLIPGAMRDLEHATQTLFAALAWIEPQAQSNY